MKTLLCVFGCLVAAPVWADVSVRALGEKSPTAVEALPEEPAKHTIKTNLLSHLKEEKRTAPVPLPPPTMLPPTSGFGGLPPLPSDMGGYVPQPPYPRSSSPSPKRSSRSPVSHSAPSVSQSETPKVDYKALFPSCVADLQQKASGNRSKLLRNDNRAYSITWIDGNGGGHIGSCYTDRPPEHQ